jgi:hypothetical protein
MFDYVPQEESEGILVQHLVVRMQIFFWRDQKVFRRFLLIYHESPPFQKDIDVRSQNIERGAEPLDFLSQVGELCEDLVVG